MIQNGFDTELTKFYYWATHCYVSVKTLKRDSSVEKVCFSSLSYHKDIITINKAIVDQLLNVLYTIKALQYIDNIKWIFGNSCGLERLVEEM